jgi:nucleoside-diphosphate-sugar epimerase
MNEIAKTVVSLTNSRSKLSYRPLPQDDPKKRKPDITKIRKAVGWEPKVSLKDGLARTIESFRG